MKITINGDYPIGRNLSGIQSGKMIVLVSGAVGAASATFSYEDEDGVIVPLTGGDIVAGEQYVISSGLHLDLFISVTGADVSTAINVMVRGKV